MVTVLAVLLVLAAVFFMVNRSVLITDDEDEPHTTTPLPKNVVDPFTGEKLAGSTGTATLNGAGQKLELVVNESTAANVIENGLAKMEDLQAKQVYFYRVLRGANGSAHCDILSPKDLQNILLETDDAEDIADEDDERDSLTGNRQLDGWFRA
jgi:hypothetical protein